MKKPSITKPPLAKEWLRKADEIADALRQRAAAENDRRAQTPINKSDDAMADFWSGESVKSQAQRKPPRR